MATRSRNTRQKDAIRQAFRSANRPLSHEEALTLAQAQVKGLSIATLYRNIRLLLEERWLTPVEVPGSATRYEVAGKGHHHHFHCNRCGRMYEMEGCGIEAAAHAPANFEITGHEFFAYGFCSSCR